MYCMECGKKIDDKSVYCEFCGTKVKVENMEVNRERKDNEIQKQAIYEESKNSNMVQSVIGIIIAIVLFIGIYFYNQKCELCGAHFAMKRNVSGQEAMLCNDCYSGINRLENLFDF